MLSGSGARSLNPDTVFAFEGLTRYYHRLYRTVPASQLIQPVAGHVQFGLDLAALGAGRIIAFDLRLPNPAQRYYRIA